MDADEEESPLIADFNELFSPSSSSSSSGLSCSDSHGICGYELQVVDSVIHLSHEAARTRIAVAALQKFTMEYFYNAAKKSLQQQSVKSSFTALQENRMAALCMPLNFAHPLVLLLTSKAVEPGSNDSRHPIDVPLLISIAIAQCSLYSDATDGIMRSYLLQIEVMVTAALSEQHSSSRSVNAYCSLLVDSDELSDFSDSPLKIALLLLAGRPDSAFAVALKVIASILKTIPTSTALSRSSNAAISSSGTLGAVTGLCSTNDWLVVQSLVSMVQLRTITAMVEVAVCEPAGDSVLLQRLLHFSAVMSSALPVIDVCVRIALFLSAMHHRADVTLCLLRYPPQYDFSLYALLAEVAAGALPSALAEYIRGGSGSSRRQKSCPGARIVTQETLFGGQEECQRGAHSEDKELSSSFAISRAEAVDALSSLPEGSFLLRPHEAHKELCFLSFRGSKECEVKHAVIRRDIYTAVDASSGKSSNVYRYRCGKIEACQTLEDVLHTISRAVPGGLIFDSDAVQRAVGGVISEKTGACGGVRRVDSNHVFWAIAKARLVLAKGVDFTSSITGFATGSSDADDSSDMSDDTDDPELQSVGAGGLSPPRDSERVSPAVAHIGSRISSRSPRTSERYSELGIADDNSEAMHSWADPILKTCRWSNKVMMYNVLASLSVKTLYKQLLAHYSELKELFRSRTGPLEAALQVCVVDSLRTTVSPSYCSHISADSELIMQPILLALLNSYCSSSALMAEAVAPPPPAAVIAPPGLGLGLGLAEAEALVSLMMQSIRAKVVRQTVPSTGSELLLEAYDVSDVSQWLQLVIEKLSQQVHRQDGADGDPHLAAAASSASRSKSRRSGRSGRPLRPSGKSGSKRGLGRAINEITLNAAARLHELVKSRVGLGGAGSSSSGDLLFGAPLAAVVVADMTAAVACLSDLWPFITGCSSRSSSLLAEANAKELAERVLRWLTLRAGVLRLFVRPPETSFQAALSYVLYSDAWTVSVTTNEQLSSAIALGRHRYKPIVNENTHNATLFSKFISSAGYPFISARGENEQHAASAFERLWDALRAEAWVVNTLTTAMPRSVPAGVATLNRAPNPDPFREALSRHLYRNTLMARMGVSNRFTVHITVDILGLREVSAYGPGPASVDLTMVARLSRVSGLGIGVRGAADIALGSLSNKAYTEGTACTPAHKASIVRSTEIRNYTEYAWKEQVRLSFALPEGLLALPPAEHRGDRAGPLHHLVNSPLCCPPTVLQLSVFEKAFFADTKLGDLDFPLLCLSEEHSFREWLPLSSSSKQQRSGSWFICVQAQLQFHMMSLDEDAVGAPPLEESGGSRGERGYSTHVSDHI